MFTFTIFRTVTAEEAYMVKAETFDEAVELIDEGLVEPYHSETVRAEDRRYNVVEH